MWPNLRHKLFFILFSAAAFGNKTSIELYSEQSYLSRENILPHATRFQTFYNYKSWLKPYFKVGGEFSLLDTQEKNFTSETGYAFVAPGVNFSWKMFQLSTELRRRQFFQDDYAKASGQSKWDERTLLVYGQFWEFPIKESKFSQILETYSEELFTTADENNLIHASFVRYGIRRTINHRLSSDFFVEPFITLDRVGHFYNNRADGKVSLRVNHTISKAGVYHNLTGSYLRNHYFVQRNKDRNPYQEDLDGYRVLYSLGLSL